MALLSAEIGLLRQRLNDAPKDVKDQLARVSVDAANIGSELHRFSHELHPARLWKFGLEASIRHLCDELSEARRLAVDLDMSAVPALEEDLALCLYRIAQEALHNVIKHSGASRAMVALRTDGGKVVLSVTDNGAGFDLEEVRYKDTLGLVSMKERARLVHAHLRISSTPGAGTTIEVHLPLDSSHFQSTF
jgi:signal transduction histidine kinase